MKHRFAAFILAAAICIGLTACSGNAGDGSSIQTDTANKDQNRIVQLTDTVDPNAKDVKTELTYSMSNRLSPCGTLGELKDKSTDVIRGEIIGVTYFNMTTMPYTKIDLRVDEALYGELQPGDMISAYKLGGYIRLRDSDPDIRQRYPEITEAEMNNTVFEYLIDGDPHPAVGQEGIFFLKPKMGNMPEGLYLITDGYDGQFIKRTDGNYARHYEGNASFVQGQGLVGYSLDDPGSAYETDRSQVTGLNGVLSYEGIKEDLENEVHE